MLRRSCAALILIALAVLLVLSAVVSAPVTASSLPHPGPGTLRVATFNALGNSHTTAAGEHPGRMSGPARTALAVKVFDYRNLDVIGLQEFQPAQQRRFRALAGYRYGLFCPGGRDNCVAWDRARVGIVARDSFAIPYFGGHIRRMPLVTLVNRTNGQHFTVTSVHNPANVHGPARALRRQGWAIERGIHADLKLGDRNDTARWYLPHLAAGEHAAGRVGIDFIVGRPDVQFRHYRSIRTSRTQRATDHPLVYADMTLRSTR